MKAENYLEQLSEIGKEILNTLLATLKERGIKSINLYDYWSERDTDRYCFYDTDNDGIELKMLDTDDGDWAEWDEENLTTTERYYLLDMVEQILEVADEEDNGRVLTADETFDDWE